MNDYKATVTVAHDSGKQTFKFVVALCDSHSQASARTIAMICKSEGCPETAIIKVQTELKD